MDDAVQGGRDLLADGSVGEIHTGHQDHILQPSQRIPGIVGVDRRHAPLVARVHRLEHVEGLRATALTHDDAVRAHTETVDHQILDRNLSLPLNVGGAGLERHHVLLP